MMKKTLCLLLALALCLPLLPASALAADGTAGEDRQLYFRWDNDGADPELSLSFAPQTEINGFFYISQNETLVQLADAAALSFEPDADVDGSLIQPSWSSRSSRWLVWFETFGAGRLVYTDETGVRYSMAAACALPSEGFSTAATLTEETYLEHAAYCPLNQPFYFVFTENIQVTEVSAAVVRGSTATVTAEVLSDHPNVCSFVITNAVFSDQYVDGCLMLDASFLLADRSTRHTSFLFSDPTPRFGFRLYQRSGSFSENLFRSVKTEAGFTNRLGFFLSSGDDSSLLDLASVTFLPAEGTDAGAMTATKLSGGIWQLDSVLPGQGTLHCTAADSIVYTLPVDIALPSTGFFSERRMATETYLPSYDFDEAAEEHVVWFMTKNGFSAGDITGWAGRDRLDAPVTLKAYLQVETVAREDDSELFDIKLTIQAIPGCRLTVWPERSDGGHMSSEELEILNTKKLERLTPLDAPTDLAWAGDYPGDIRCKSGALFQDLLLWTLYQVGNPTPLARRETAYSGRYDPDSWRVDDLFWRSYRDYPDRESGDYYFTVQAVGDEEQYKDSPVATSPIWHYERPEAELTAPSGLHWEGQTACWSDESNHAADLYGYEIQFRCVAPETGAETGTKYTLTMDELSSGGLKHTLQDWVKDLLGSGTCQFRLRAVSGDITRFRHSQWSAFSAESTQLTAPSTVAKALDQLLTDYTPSEGAELTEEQTTALKSAVAAKKDELERTLCSGADSSNGVAGKLQELEALVGGPATVTVTGAAPEEIKDAQKGVSIVGASLNGTADVTLKIDKAETVSAEDPINPAQYHNTIPFSMTLEGVSAQGQHQPLSVPVLITLPLPGSIRPSFLVLLHKIGDDWQEIFPYQVFYDETLRQDCVRFTVTSFSDFAFAQQLSCGIERLDAKSGQLTVCATADVKRVVAAVYDGSGKQLGCAAADAGTAGGTLTLNLPALKTGVTVRVFFLNKNGQPVCPAAQTIIH